MNAFISGLSQ